MMHNGKVIEEMLDTIEDGFKDAESHIDYAIDARDENDMEAMQMHKQDAQTRMNELTRWCDAAKKKFGDGGLSDVMCRSFTKRREKLMEKFRRIDEK